MPETSPASVKPKRNRARTQTRNYTDMCAHFARYLSADRAVEDEGGILFRGVVDREGHFRWTLLDVDDFHIDHGNGRTEIQEHLVNYALRRWLPCGALFVTNIITVCPDTSILSANVRHI